MSKNVAFLDGFDPENLPAYYYYYYPGILRDKTIGRIIYSIPFPNDDKQVNPSVDLKYWLKRLESTS